MSALQQNAVQGIDQGGVVQSGDVVRLKSGGPPMTAAVGDEGKIEVWWFNADGEMQRSVLPPFALCPDDSTGIGFDVVGSLEKPRKGLIHDNYTRSA